jgi:ketosteroid isomerase-like protein
MHCGLSFETRTALMDTILNRPRMAAIFTWCDAVDFAQRWGRQPWWLRLSHVTAVKKSTLCSIGVSMDCGTNGLGWANAHLAFEPARAQAELDVAAYSPPEISGENCHIEDGKSTCWLHSRCCQHRCTGGASTTQATSAGDCWMKAMTAGDVDTVAACYLPDAVMWFPHRGLLTERAAIRKGYADYFAAYTIKSAVLHDMGHVDAGDARTNWGTFAILMISKADGKPVTERGRLTDVTHKVGGCWLYAVDHASDDPAQGSD